jgi:hypothetical protein
MVKATIDIPGSKTPLVFTFENQSNNYEKSIEGASNQLKNVDISKNESYKRLASEMLNAGHFINKVLNNLNVKYPENILQTKNLEISNNGNIEWFDVKLEDKDFPLIKRLGNSKYIYAFVDYIDMISPIDRYEPCDTVLLDKICKLFEKIMDSRFDRSGIDLSYIRNRKEEKEALSLIEKNASKVIGRNNYHVEEDDYRRISMIYQRIEILQ